MPKAYGKAGLDVLRRIKNLRDKHHEDLKDVTLAALFVYDDDQDQHVLSHRGYPAIAITKIVPLRDRAAGLPDAMIVIDRHTYGTLTAKQMDAMLDHELHHLELVVDDKTGTPKCDAIGRPKLAMRKHDHSFGWFDEIARRHGQHSIEVMQASALVETTGQLYFEWGDDAA